MLQVLPYILEGIGLDVIFILVKVRQSLPRLLGDPDPHT